jgi:hypothetical protein
MHHHVTMPPQLDCSRQFATNSSAGANLPAGSLLTLRWSQLFTKWKTEPTDQHRHQVQGTFKPELRTQHRQLSQQLSTLGSP